MQEIIAIDPGREKCGAAVLMQDGTFREEVIPTEDLTRWVKEARRQYPGAPVIMGNGTGSEAAQRRIEEACGCRIETVEEYKTTEEAKKRYWIENPPRGLKRLIPTSMQVPPVPVDGYVAVILAERYRAGMENKV